MTFTVDPKQFSILSQSVAYSYGLSASAVEQLFEQALAAYARKRAGGVGNFEVIKEGNTYNVYRIWNLIPNEAVMENVDEQWRVMDAHDEGFAEADVGDEVKVQEPAIEVSRKTFQWIEQSMRRGILARRHG